MFVRFMRTVRFTRHVAVLDCRAQDSVTQASILMSRYFNLSFVISGTI